jgi:myo-inositol 2-dehydrogenase/D-chiro-inositol 1-dehydrogenase
MSDLRIAVLGVGMMGAFHVDALSRRIRGAKVTVINDFFTDKAHEVAAPIGARVVEDPIAAINDPEVDAVLIATPGKAHDEQVNACLDRGIPVLCEKPLTTDIASSYAIVQKEAALDRPLIQVGFMRRFDHEYVALQKLITDGALGNPLIVHCTHRNPAVPDFFNSEYMIRDSVVHEVDVARFLLGEEITSVQVIAGVATSAAPHGTSDPMIVIFETESGRIVTDEISVRTGVAYEVRTEVVGERGSAVIGLDQNLQVKGSDGRWGGQLTPGFVERFGAAYDVELQRWVDAAKAGTIDGPGAWDGYAAVAVCEAGVEAVRTGRKVLVRLGARPGEAPPPTPEPVKPADGQKEPAVRHPDTAEYDAEEPLVGPTHHEPKVVDDSPAPGITAPDMEAAR